MMMMMPLELYCVVQFSTKEDEQRETIQISVIPSKYCEAFYDKDKLAAFYNIGIERQRNDNYHHITASKMFYVPCGSLHSHLYKPDFKIAVNNSVPFKEQIAAMYNGYVLKIFSKLFIIII